MNWKINTLVLAVLCSTQAFGDVSDQPFHTANRSPFVQIHGVPASQSADILSGNASEIQFSTEAASYFTLDSKQEENLFLDGEGYRVEWSGRFAVADGLEAGVVLPYLIFDGGSLDGFIDNWHDTFGLPDGGREDYAKDKLLLRYSDGGKTRVNVTDREDGLGDVQLHVGYALAEGWALRTMVKLPTGDADKLTGSDGTDVSLALHYSSAPASTWRVHASAGALWMEQGDVIAARQEEWAAFASLAVVYRATDTIALKAQVDGHSALYNSHLKQLGSSTQLVLGGSWRFNQKAALEFYVSEDIDTETAPDVVFNLGVRTLL